MDEEIKSKPNLKELLKQRIEAENEQFTKWWNNLDSEVQNKYKSLAVGGDLIKVKETSEETLEWHLKKCQLLLSLIQGMKDSDGKKIIPVQLRIDGTTPAVLVSIEGSEKPVGENKEEIRQYEDILGGGEKTHRYKSTFDTSPYGIPASRVMIAEDIYDSEYTLQNTKE